jgi:hypothetical protein
LHFFSELQTLNFGLPSFLFYQQHLSSQPQTCAIEQKTTKMSLILDGIDLDALNYTIKVPYNGSIMTGGDSLHANLNIFYDVSFSGTQFASSCADLQLSLGR